MTIIELKKVLRDRPDDIEDRLYDYGYECGKRHIIVFEIVQQLFYIYNYTENERLTYMRSILKGLKDGTRAAR